MTDVLVQALSREEVASDVTNEDSTTHRYRRNLALASTCVTMNTAQLTMVLRKT
jgi:hypothetical protein